MSSTHRAQTQHALNEIIEYGAQKSNLMAKMPQGLLEAQPYQAKIKLDWQPDYTVTLFSAAQVLQTNPAVLAAELAVGMQNVKGVERVEAIGPYVNYRLSDKNLIELIERAFAPEQSAQAVGTKGTVLIECPKIEAFTLITPKLIGHLTTAQTLANLLRVDGYKPSLHLHVSDWDYKTAQHVALRLHPELAHQQSPGGTIHLPARVIRKTMQRMQEHGSAEYETFNVGMRQWLDELTQTLAVAPGIVTMLRDSQRVDTTVATLQTAAHDHPKRISRDEDTGVIYVDADEIIPLLDGAKTPT